MAIFSWFGGNTQHRVFNYKPIYYDKEADDRRDFFGHGGIEYKRTDEQLREAGQNPSDKKAAKKTYVPGSSIQGAFRNSGYVKRRGGSKAQSIITLAGLILAVVVLIFIAKFYTLL